MKHPPYHLRTNKAVDRLLLVDLLRKLGKNCEEFTYYSLAGPFLEDFRVMDHFFPEMRLVSLEIDKDTFDRQDFHRFNSRIELHNKSLSEFLANNYTPGEKDVFWLDYTDLKYERFDEFQVVLTMVPPGSVVRITLKAKPDLDIEALGKFLPKDNLEYVRNEMQKKFDKIYEKILPVNGGDAFASLRHYARMVQLMVQQAASLALDTTGSQVDFLHVHSTRYNDNTPMVSVTGVVCLRDEIPATRAKLTSVRYADFDWGEPYLINIPALSLKERLRLEHYLPISRDQDAGEVLYQVLQYKIDEKETSSKQQLAHYAECYRDYPNFIRAMI